MEALVKCGAMDNFGERGQLMSNMETMLEYNKQRQNIGSQASLFGENSEVMALRLAPADKAETGEKLKWEKELLGLYVSGHPLEKFQDKIDKSGFNIKKIREEMRVGLPATFACIVEEVKPIITRKNERMAFLKLTDLTGSIESVIFPKAFTELQNIIVVDACLAVSATITERNGERSLIVEKAKAI